MHVPSAIGCGLATILAVSLCLPAQSAELRVTPGAAVQPVLEQAAEGDVVLLPAGEYRGPVRIDRRLTVQGEAGAVVIGPGEGSVVTVLAPGAVVRGLTIRGSGTNLPALDSGIFVSKSAAGAVVEGNRIEGNL